MGFYLPKRYVYDNQVLPIEQESPLGNSCLKNELRSDVHVYFQASSEAEISFPTPVVPRK